MRRIKVGILGASGYVGGELIQRLVKHRGVELVFLGASANAGRYISHCFPHLRNGFSPEQKQFKAIEELVDCDVFISALPQGELPKLIPQLISKTDRILNIAGDYRIDNPLLRQKYYPETMPLPDGVSAAYVIPELEDMPKAKILNLPGCMASAALYGLLPLLEKNLVKKPVNIDAKTGSSGGGSKDEISHAERSGSIRVHKLFKHRHGAEIENLISKRFGQTIPVSMTTTSVDISRGVMVHVYGQLEQLIDSLGLCRLYIQYYSPHRFIQFVNITKSPNGLPSTKAVLGTNYCEIGCAIDNRTSQFIAVSALDNLVKGAAGNAIQLLNRLYDFPLEWGLDGFGVWP